MEAAVSALMPQTGGVAETEDKQVDLPKVDKFTAFGEQYSLTDREREVLRALLSSGENVQDGVFTYDGGTMTITTSYGSLTGTADNVKVPENITVTVTVSPKEGYSAQLWVNGAQVTLNNNVYTVVTSANRPELKFEACFINPGNPNPPSGNQPICLILEGDAFKGADTDYYHYMKSQDKSFEIYVDLDDTGNSRSQTMDNLMKEQKVSLAPESQSTYCFADSVSNARVTVMCSSGTYTITTPGTTSNGSYGERSFAVKKEKANHTSRLIRNLSH